MSISSYLTSLKEKHNHFKKAIKKNLINHIYDEVAVKNLKKQKLLVKEKITQIEIQQASK